VIYLVETACVAPENGPAYIEALEKLFRPRAEAAGLELVACWHTPAEIGQDVDVVCILRFADWGTWDEIRRRMVLDPALSEWHAARRRLALRAERRFCEPAAFSPLA
jgi:hypothetical protein